jgi:magnesium chelatase subunit I
VGRPNRLGELKASGYRPRSVREELRANLIARIRNRRPLFPEMIGYADQCARDRSAILAGHAIFLGERGRGRAR